MVINSDILGDTHYYLHLGNYFPADVLVTCECLKNVIMEKFTLQLCKPLNYTYILNSPL
jgi:hypothetical protein